MGTRRKIGTHSIRKGANTHGCSLPGQTGNIPMMLHGGWAIKGNSIEYPFQTNGDSQNVATILSGLNPNSTDFAILPMRFNSDVQINLQDIVEDHDSYPPETLALILRLLPCAVYHKEFIRKLLHPEHPFFISRFWRGRWMDRLHDFLLPVGKMYTTGIPPVTQCMYQVEQSEGKISTLEASVTSMTSIQLSEVNEVVTESMTSLKTEIIQSFNASISESIAAQIP